MNTLIETYGLQKINTATKYPSILTYHNLGEKGSLVDSLVDGKSFNGAEVYITEKIDGTNSRVIAVTDAKGRVADYIIGSREDLLYAHGDRIINQSQGIVNAVNPFANSLLSQECHLKESHVYCIYGETFGGNINGAKQYTSKKTFGFRIFDVWLTPVGDFEEILAKNIDSISSWREHGGQPYVSAEALIEFSKTFGIGCVPYIKKCDGGEIPTSLKDTYEWLCQFEKTRAVLDEGYSGPGHAEGVVVRTEGRELIRKIRFEDYERTKKRGLF